MAIDDRVRRAFDELAASLRQELEERADALARELAAAAEEERKAIEAESMSRLASELGAARAAADARAAEERERAAADARAESAAEREHVLAEADELRAEADRLRAEIARLEEEAGRLRTDAARAQEELEAARASAREAGAELAAIRSAAEQSAAELNAARAVQDSLRAEVEAERLRADALAGETRAALDRAAAAEQALHAARDRAAIAEQALQESRGSEVAERQDHMAGLDRLAASLRRIGEASSLNDVLRALADAAAEEASRAAVLVTTAGNGPFEILRASGFDAVPPGPVPREAISNLSRGLPFAPLSAGRAGHAVPIEIGRQTVAVLYGDDGDTGSGRPHAAPSPWAEALEILAGHASLRLEALTALRTAQALGVRGGPGAGTPVATMGASPASAPSRSSTEDDQSARRYARLLVSEIKLYNETAVRAGRERRDLLARLRSEIDRARRLYEERVPATVPGRSAYFDDEIVQILADGDPGLLGQASGTPRR